MALEAVIYPQLDPFGYVSSKDFLFHNLYFQEQHDQDHQDSKNHIKMGQEGLLSTSCVHNNSNSENSNSKATGDHQWNYHHHYSLPSSLEGFYPLLEQENPAAAAEEIPPPVYVASTTTTTGQRKRRRTRSNKNKEEIEYQRMTHIAVERNRRKQMNEYLAVLRSLMPPSYAQRGDQASIISGAINYVKELEHLLQSMEPPRNDDGNNVPFSDFFSFPQYSSRPSTAAAEEGAAEIEVSIVESHANMKILTKKRPKQLLKLVNGIQSLGLTVLHLNVTTLDQSVLYSISIKVEEGSQLNTVDDIAAAMNQILRRIDEESAFS